MGIRHLIRVSFVTAGIFCFFYFINRQTVAYERMAIALEQIAPALGESLSTVSQGK